MSKERDLSNDTFCFYCQVDKRSPAKLRAHIAKAHPGTYADNAYNRPKESS